MRNQYIGERSPKLSRKIPTIRWKIYDGSKRARNL